MSIIPFSFFLFLSLPIIPSLYFFPFLYLPYPFSYLPSPSPSQRPVTLHPRALSSSPPAPCIRVAHRPLTSHASIADNPPPPNSGASWGLWPHGRDDAMESCFLGLLLPLLTPLSGNLEAPSTEQFPFHLFGRILGEVGERATHEGRILFCIGLFMMVKKKLSTRW